MTDTFSWYSKKLPNVGDIVMFTTRYTNDKAYYVTLDEYQDREAFLSFSELSKKRIRKNPSSFLKKESKNCAIVSDVGDNIISLSLISVSKDQKKQHSELYGLNSKLFGLCRRLAHIQFQEKEWYDVLRNAMEKSLELGYDHPYATISDRSTLKNIENLPACYVDCILENHAKMFGMKPFSIKKRIMLITFQPDGNQVAKDEICRISHELKSEEDNYTDEQLYQDQSKINICVNPVALPVCEFSITAYQDALCKQVSDELMLKLKQSKFDIVEKVN